MKNLIGLLVFIGSFTTLHGQFLHSVGLKYGVSLGDQELEYGQNFTVAETEYRTGIFAAVNVEVLRSDFFSLTADLGYIQKGRQQKFEVTTATQPEGTGEIRTYDSRFDYMTFYPAFRFLYEIGDFAPYAFGGPRVDYFLGYQSDLDLSDQEDDYDNLIFGLSYGIGFEYEWDNIGVFIEGQHQPDFSEVLTYDPAASNNGVTIYNNTFVLAAGVKYIFD